MLREPLNERRVVGNKLLVLGIQSRFVMLQVFASVKEPARTLQQPGHGRKAKELIPVLSISELSCAEKLHGVKHSAVHGKAVSA